MSLRCLYLSLHADETLPTNLCWHMQREFLEDQLRQAATLLLLSHIRQAGLMEGQGRGWLLLRIPASELTSC